MGKTRVKRSKSRLNKKTRRQRGGWPKWLSCLGGKCNNVANPMAVATNNPMRNVANQRRPTGTRNQRANNRIIITNNPLGRRPANSKHLTASEIEQLEASAAEELAKQIEIAKKRGARIAGTLQSMSNSTAEAKAEAEAEWREPRPNQTQAERNAELAEINRKEQEATEWSNSPVATPPRTKIQQAGTAAFNTGGQPEINEARRNLPAGWHADYDKNGRILYYFQSSPRSAVTKEQYKRPT